MRTTVDLSPDLLDRVRQRADEDGISFKEALARIVASGLDALAANARPKLDLPAWNIGFERYFDIRKTKEILGEMDDERILRSMSKREEVHEDS